MGDVGKFEDLKIWQQGRNIVNEIYDISNQGLFAKDYALKNQIRDAALSITSNIAEGFERDGDAEKISFLSYAKGSTGEVRSQMYTALDQKYISKEQFDKLYAMLVEESKMLSGMIGYIQKSKFKGRKYKDRG